LALLKHRRGDQEGALNIYKQAISKGDVPVELYYNMGLLLVEMNRSKEALAYARKAYARGYPLRGLAKKLQAEGMEIDF
jgi:tetratricopeptide (TPR) repeat protein